MKRLITAMIMATAMTAGVGWAQDKKTDLVKLWENATFMEKTEGDYQGAIKGYTKILAHPRVGETLKGKVKLRIAVCKLRLGEHDDAVKGFSEVFKTHPKLAKDYLLEMQKIGPVDGGMVGNARPTTKKKYDGPDKALLDLVIPKMSFVDARISKVFNLLHAQSKKLDPKRKGVIFSLKLPSRKAREEGEEEGDVWGKVEENPKVKKKKKYVEPTITMDFDSIPLGQAVRYICEQANLKYKLRNGGITILGPGMSVGNLELRFFPIDPDMVKASMEDNDEGEVDFQRTFENMGVEFNTMTDGSKASISYDRGTSQLIVRNTAEQLRLMEIILKRLNIAVPQMQLQVDVLELQIKPGTLSRVDPGRLSKFIAKIPQDRKKTVVAMTVTGQSGHAIFLENSGEIMWAGKKQFAEKALNVTTQVAADNLSISMSVHFQLRLWNSPAEVHANRRNAQLMKIVEGAASKGPGKTMPNGITELGKAGVSDPQWKAEMRTEKTIWDGECHYTRLGQVLIGGKPGIVVLKLRPLIVDPAGIPLRDHVIENEIRP